MRDSRDDNMLGTGHAGGPGFVLVAAAAALWGSDALFRRGLALELPAATVVFVEHVILVLLTVPLLVRGLRATRSFTVRDWIALVVVGAGASATATILFTQAFTYGNPTTPLLLQKLQPVIAIVGARLVLGERLLPRYALYFVSALAGAYLISFPDPMAVSVDAAAPALLAVGAAALWGMGTVLGRHLSAKIDFGLLTALRFAVGLPAAATILLVQGPAPSLPAAGSSWLALLLLALVPGLLALLLYYRGLRQTPASAATLAELAFPLSAVAVNLAAFGTTLVPTQWLGMVTLLVTITIMGLRSARGSTPVGIELAQGASLQAATS
jgi:drug/metabolite transporter, DME family